MTHFNSTAQIIEISQQLKVGALPGALVVASNSKQVFRDFLSRFTLIKAAGGWVINQKEEVLFIFRLGKWDLPKGKLEVGEESAVGAQREVEEECGVVDLKNQGWLCTTYHAYELNEATVVKETEWYRFKTTYQGILTPQEEEDITDAEWVSFDRLEKVKANTYSAILDVITLAQRSSL